MNKVFKTVRNRVRGAYVAVNENTRSAMQSSGKTELTNKTRVALVPIVAATLAASFAAPSAAWWRESVPGGQTITTGVEANEGENRLTLGGDMTITSAGTMSFVVGHSAWLTLSSQKISNSGNLFFGTWENAGYSIRGSAVIDLQVVKRSLKAQKRSRHFS